MNGSGGALNPEPSVHAHYKEKRAEDGDYTLTVSKGKAHAYLMLRCNLEPQQLELLLKMHG